MKFIPILSAALAAVVLAGCADMQNNPKQTAGTILGAGTGALIGSQIGSGKGQMAAIAIGTLAGAMVGGSIGRSLDDVDRMKAQQTTQTALERVPDGRASTWSNPNTGHSGSVTPTYTYKDAGGRDCREFRQAVTIEGRTEEAVGTACRQPDGTWRIIN
jgi:surface antigen